MASVQPQLSLDFKSSFVPKTIGDFLKELSLIENVAERESKLDDYVKKLEDEMTKVEAFKRELPLSMLLLRDAIQALREGSGQCKPLSNTKPVMEEFLPLKKESDEVDNRTKKEIDSKDKKIWMSSLQLGNGDNHDSVNDAKRNGDNLLQSHRYGRTETAFMSFEAHPCFPTVMVRTEEKKEFMIHGLSLLTPDIKAAREQLGYSASNTGSEKVVGSSPSIIGSNTRTRSQQPAKKQRRCWSPELHRQFLNALQQLGGAQVATPKQIRDLMQVDGLTNDEVKSHLQKYRLHIQRLPASTATPSDQSPVALNGTWTAQDHYSDFSKSVSSQFGSPEGPLQLAGNSGGTSTTGDSMDDDEGEKCDSHSC